MIKVKGRKLIFTGKDEKMIKREAKRLGLSPQALVDELVKVMNKNLRVIEKDIIIEKI